LKRAATDVDGGENPNPAAKIIRTDALSGSSDPLGLIWDCDNYSCAYDSLFTVLSNIWTDAPNVWSDRFDNVSGYLSMLSEGFLLVKNESISFEAARDTVRLELHRLDSTEYPMGAAFTCLAALTHRMMVKEERCDSGTTFLSCVACGYKGNTLLHIGEYLSLNDAGPFHDSMCERGQISDCLGWHLSDHQKTSQIPCPRCSEANTNPRNQLALQVSMNRIPYIMCVMLNQDTLRINDTLSYPEAQYSVFFRLRGVVYGDGNHFVARLVTKHGDVWYHDGMTTGSVCVFEGRLDWITDRDWLMNTSRGYNHCKAMLAIYG